MSQSQSSFLETWGVPILLSGAAFVLVLDIPIMTIAIAAIVADLQTTVQGIQAAVALYAVVIAACTIAGGRLGHVFGMRHLFIIGLVCYILGTLVATFTPNLEILAIGWSLLKGIGVALMLARVLALLTQHAENQQLALSLGVIHPRHRDAITGGQVAGVVIGLLWGGFLATQFSWRLAFASEVLMGLPIFILVGLLPPSERRREAFAQRSQREIDWLGMVLVATGLAFTLFGVILASHYGWLWAKHPFLVGDLEVAPFGLSIVPFLIALGLISFVTLGLWQRQQEQLGKTPLVPTALLRHRPFLAGVTAGGLWYLIMAGILFTLAVFLQGALGMSPLDSGRVLLPEAIGLLVVTLSSASLAQWVNPRYVMMFGLVIMLSGLAMLYPVLTPAIQGTDLLAGLLVLGCGSGLVLAQVTPATLSKTPPETVGDAVGISHAVQHIGTALGTAIVGSVLITALLSGIVTGVAQKETLDLQTQQVTIAGLQDAVQALSPDQTTAFVSRFSPDEQARLTEMVKRTWVQAEQVALITLMVLTLLCLLAVYCL